MPKTEETVLQNDPSVAENGAPEPKTPGQSQKSKSFCLDDQSPDLIETVNEVSKLSISHEIVVNQDFYVEETILPPNSVEGRFAEAMYNAFWNHLKEQLLSTPPDFTCALELLKDVKETLLSLLLPWQNRLRNEIEEALDTDLLKQEAEHGALDVPHLSNYILNLMALLCAPVRDEAIQKLETIRDPVQLLRGIFRVLGLMKMDMVNYTIQSFRPYLQEHSIQYEQAKFQELLDKQPSLLDYTTKWLTKAATDITTLCPSSPDSPSSSCSMACSLPSGAGNNSEPPSPTMVLYQGYLNLLLWDLENVEFPETLLMDRIRLQELAFQLHQLTVLASVLLVARSFSGEVLFRSPEFVDRLKCITKALTEEFISRPEETMLSVSEQVSQEVHQGLKDMGLTTLSTENTASLLGQLQNITKKENCIRSIVDQWIRFFLKCCLLHGMQESLLHFLGGLILIEKELAELGWKFLNLMHHNQQVFGPYYAEILKHIIHPAQAQETDVEPN
ncbi:T-complex protein 11-like X-linked protein 2 isoform X1 [Pan paniscus]|uniref:T-complex protein 11-like X-linked protein 2 isoform X1 n=1 Tax=Pan paniscus TaxID=9597 RepID=UPI002436738F|nr:T-complex protein 11 X-linked protein 2 isoform X1 [Pan paniscus]XP_054962292.1 T-complex protein 11 homolog isoform X1 [Pan paniscus]